MILLRIIASQMIAAVGMVLFVAGAGLVAFAYFLRPLEDERDAGDCIFVNHPVSPLEKQAEN